MKQDQTSEIISLCKGLSCTISGAEDVHDELDREIYKRELSQKIEVIGSCCKGKCEYSPNATLLRKGEQLNKITVEKVKKILDDIEYYLNEQQ